METFRRKRPEIPHRGRTAEVGLGIAFLCVDEVTELERITDEEDRRIVAHQVPIAFFGVELDCKATYIAFGIGRAAFTGDDREAHKHLSLLVYLREELGLRVAGDIVRHGEDAMSSRSFGVNHSFRHALTVEVRHLLDQMEILHQEWATWTSRQRILVITYRAARLSGETLFV